MLNLPHPDALTDLIKTKEIKWGGMQAIEDKAIESYHRALSEGKSKEEVERIYFSFFNKAANGVDKHK